MYYVVGIVDIGRDDGGIGKSWMLWLLCISRPDGSNVLHYNNSTYRLTYADTLKLIFFSTRNLMLKLVEYCNILNGSLL